MLLIFRIQLSHLIILVGEKFYFAPTLQFEFHLSLKSQVNWYLASASMIKRLIIFRSIEKI